MKLEGISENDLVQPLSFKLEQDYLSFQIVSIFKDGDTWTVGGNLFQCMTTLIVKKKKKKKKGTKKHVFKTFFLYFNLCPLPLFPSLKTTEKPCSIFFTVFCQTFIRIPDCSTNILFLSLKSWISQPVLLQLMLWALCHLCDSLTESAHKSMSLLYWGLDARCGLTRSE